MFQESPFTGACAASTWEVLLMLVGTLLLGVLLGYLIWGWVRSRVVLLDQKVRELGHIVDLKDGQIVALNTRIGTIKQDLDREQAQAQAKEAQYGAALSRIKSLTEDLDALKDAGNHGKGQKEAPQRNVEATKQSHKETSDTPKPTSAKTGTSDPLRKGSSKASLAVAAGIFGKTIKANDLKLIEGIGPKISDILASKGIKTWAKLAQARVPELRKVLEDAGARYRLHDPKTWPRQSRMAAKGEWKKLKAYQETLKGGK